MLRRGDSNLQRIKARGVVSHFLAQRRALCHWICSQKPLHAVVVRVYDDTNIWIAPCQAHSLTELDGDDEPGPQHDQHAQASTAVGRLGKRKVTPLMGLVQRIFLTSSDGRSVAQVHTPAQVLPKANTQTIYSRLQRWAVLSCHGQSEHMGGAEMDTAWRSVPFKVLATCASAALLF